MHAQFCSPWTCPDAGAGRLPAQRTTRYGAAPEGQARRALQAAATVVQ